MSEYGVGANINGEMVEVVKPKIDERVKALEVRTGSVANVRSFGAKGDGATDDSAALASIRAFEANNPKTPVMWPAGTYNAGTGIGQWIGSNALLDNVDIGGYAKSYKDRLTVVPFIREFVSYPHVNMQGGTCDDTYVYPIYLKDTDNNGQVIEKINTQTGYVELTVEHTDLGHANSATCDDDYIYVAPTDVDHKTKIIKVSKATLQTVSIIDVSSTAGAVYAVAYDKITQRFFVRNGVSGVSQICIYDKDFNYISRTEIYDEWSEGGGDSRNISTQDIFFYRGDLYGFVFAVNKDGGHNNHYIVKYDKNGRYQKTWLLDIRQEVENVSVYKDKFLVGVNSTQGSRYDFYLLDPVNDGVKPAWEASLLENDADDFGYSAAKAHSLYVKKFSDGYVLAGMGEKNNPFSSVQDALFYGSRICKHNQLQQMLIYIDGDFSDEAIEIVNYPVYIAFVGVENSGAKLGPIHVFNSNVRVANGNISGIYLTEKNKSLGYGVFVEGNSFVDIGRDIVNLSSVKTYTVGIKSQNGPVVRCAYNSTITGFQNGIDTRQATLFENNNTKFSYSNCDTPVVSYGSCTFTDKNYPYNFVSANDGAVLAANNVATKQFTIRNVDTHHAIFYTNHSPTENYTGLLIASQTTGTNITGARLMLRAPDSPLQAGAFVLNANNGTTNKQMLGQPDGTLTWNGQPMQTTSDERFKTPLAEIPDAVLEAWGSVQWGQFRYLADVDKKGDKARLHNGLIAQHILRVFEEHGQNALAYGIVCHETWEDEKNEDGVVVREAGEMYSVRYTEALAMEAAYQRHRADMLEQRISKVETLLNDKA